MKMGTTNNLLIQYFWDNDLPPTRHVVRHDGTVELVWHVDDCDERYVRATSTQRSVDYVLVSRNLREVASAVLSDLREIHSWVRSHLVDMVEKKLNHVHGKAAEEVEGG